MGNWFSGSRRDGESVQGGDQPSGRYLSREELAQAWLTLKSEKEDLEREKEEIMRRKADMDEQMRKNKWAFSPSYQSRVENNDATPGQGPKTHQDLGKSFDKFFRTAPRDLHQKVKTEYGKEFSKDDVIKKVMCTVFQEVYNQSKTLVLETLFEELQMVLKYAESEDQQLSGGCEPEILWQRRRAYAILLHTASDRLCTSKQQAGMKAIEVLQTKSESFKELHSTAPGLIGTYVKRAAEISWNMVTTSPPCIVWQPPSYNEDWHEKLSSKWEVKKGQTGTLVYYKPVLFYDASGMDVRKGLVGSVHTAPGTGQVIEDEESESENDGEYESLLGRKEMKLSLVHKSEDTECMPPPNPLAIIPIDSEGEFCGIASSNIVVTKPADEQQHSFYPPPAPPLSYDSQGKEMFVLCHQHLPSKDSQEVTTDLLSPAHPLTSNTRGTNRTESLEGNSSIV